MARVSLLAIFSDRAVAGFSVISLEKPCRAPTRWFELDTVR